MKNKTETTCTSCFKNDEKEALSKALTLKWAEVINQMERSKSRTPHSK